MVNRYLTLISLERALSIMKTSFEGTAGLERIAITEAVGRVIAVPVFAKYSVPEANLAAMDGIAVRSADTIGASDQMPVTLEQIVRVNTGNIVPQGFDAVIMIEDTWECNGRFQIRKSAGKNQHIRPAGEDIKENQLVLPIGHYIRPFDIGALATYGMTHVDVKMVRIGIIPTGSELVPLGVRPAPGQVVESNTIMAQVFLSSMGASCTRYPIIRDDPELIAKTLTEAVRDNDFVIISAGSSAGTRDFTAGVIQSLGELLFHGVAVRPGKPVMLGRISGKPVLGLPGYPLAAQTIVREFAAPLLESWGFPHPHEHRVRTKLSRSLDSDLGFDDFVHVYVGRVGDACWCVPHSRGSGVQMATVRANGYIHIPAPVEGCEADSDVDAILSTGPDRIEKTLLLFGSSNPLLQDLANIVHENGLFLHATNASNMGALNALRKKACHAVSLSLPSFPVLPDCPSLMQVMPPGGLAFVHIAAISIGVASREEHDIGDLLKKRWINTKKDSAARALFDNLILSRGLDPLQVDGYRNEAIGPAAVAAAITNKTVDAGICSSGVAASAGLRFMPLGYEQFELAIHPDLLADEKIGSLISAVRSAGFLNRLSTYPGYDTTRTGSLCTITKDCRIPGIGEQFPLNGYKV